MSFIPDVIGINVRPRHSEALAGSGIEELTRRAGSPKTMQLFVKVLKSALLREAGSASVDLLAPSDLEALRPRQADERAKLLPRNRQYLILTCTSEFDKIHYPLPLTMETELLTNAKPSQVVC